MRDINKVILLGHLGADPIFNQTHAGTPVAHFSLGTQSTVDPKQSIKLRTQWHKVVVWGKLALICSQELKKGYWVYVEGSIRNRPFKNKLGQEQMSFEIHADTLSFLKHSKNIEKPQLIVLGTPTSLERHDEQIS